MTASWPAGWATGDLTVAAQYAKGMGALFDSTLGGSAANVDVTSISGSYAHLLVVAYARGDAAATAQSLAVRFNGDSAANYDYQQLTGNAASPSAVETFAAAQIVVGNMPGNTAGANLFSASVMFIPNYAGSTNNKLLLSMTSTKIGAATTNLANYLVGGFWRSAAAITRVTVTPTGGANLVAGTRVTVYGLGA